MFYLNSVHRAGGERGVGEGQRGTQQVAHTLEVVLVLLDGFDTHPLSGQQSLVARGVARRGHELEVSMTTAEEEPSPEVSETEPVQIFIYYLNPLWQQCLDLYKTHNKENIDLISLPIPEPVFPSLLSSVNLPLAPSQHCEGSLHTAAVKSLLGDKTLEVLEGLFEGFKHIYRSHVKRWTV